jgi:hypothetical protein
MIVGRRRLLPSLPIIVGLAAAARPLLAPIPLFNDPDTYLHIGAGQWIIAHLALPIRDPFSHSMSGAPWSVPEWLGEVLLAGAYDIAGWLAIILLTASCYGAAMAILTRKVLVHAEPQSTLIVMAASVAVTLPHLLARPHALALPLLVIWSGGLFTARDAGRKPSLWLLTCMIVWANLHSSFLFGLALAVYLAGEAILWPGPAGRRREALGWCAFILLAIIAALVTPNGLYGLLEPFQLMTMPLLQTSIIEWASPNFQEFQPLELWLLGAVFLGLSAGLKLPLSRLLLLIGLLHMALLHNRHADLVGLVVPLAVAASLGPQIAARVRSNPPSALAARLAALARPASLAGVLAGGVIAVLLSAPLLIRGVERGDDPVTPASALAAARQLGLSSPVFNSEGLGGYLVFRGVKTFIDGRFEMYGNSFLANYLAAQANQDALSGLLRKYRIGWTLLRPGDGAVDVMDHLPGWRRVYGDGYAVIHVRDAPPSD